MWDFATPAALLLLPLPFLAARFLAPARRGTGALWVPQTIAAGLPEVAGSGFVGAGQRLLPALLWIALVVALAGPRVVMTSPALPASGREIVLALDLSGSMDRRDFELDGKPARRLDALKRVATGFVRRRAGDRVGLVIFAEKAFFAAPSSYDVETVARTIEEATIGIAGRSTAISDGLGLALKRLEQSPSRSRVVILLSDGANNAGTVKPTDAAELARSLGVRVHTIAMGRHDLADGNDDPDAVDAETLRAVAEASGGRAFRVRSTADLEAVGHAIDALEGDRTAASAVAVFRDLWVYPAALAFLTALLIVVIDRRRA